MKKTFCALMLCLVSVALFAQLNISQGGGNTEEGKIASDTYARVVLADGYYQIRVKDIHSANHVVITLGDTKEKAISSLQQLSEWGANAKKKDYINVTEESGAIVTIYKYANNQYMVSYGDAEYCKEAYSKLLTTAFTGAAVGAYSNANPPIGYCQDSLLKKAIKKLSE